MDDNEVKKICGTDVTLYLVYLKYSAILFLISKSRIPIIVSYIVAFFSNTVLLPLFATSPKED